MESMWKFLRDFKLKSTFMEMLYLVITFCLIVCLLFSALLFKNAGRNLEEKEMLVNQTYVDTVTNETDYLMENLHQSLTQLTYFQSIASLIYSHTFSNSKVNSVISDLAIVTEHQRLINETLIYIPKYNYVITSDYAGYPLEEFSDRRLITDYESSNIAGTLLEMDGKYSQVFFYDGNVFMTRDFPLNDERKLATVYYQINLHELYRRMTIGLMEGCQLWVYDNDGNFLFENEISYSEDKSLENIINREGVYLSASEQLGWIFCYDNSEYMVQSSIWNAMESIYPFLLMALLVAIVAAVVVVVILYRPLYKIYKNLVSQNIGMDIVLTSKNEVDYLNQTVTGLVEHQNKLNRMLENVSYVFLTRLFMDRLTGSQISSKEIKDILKSTQLPFKEDDYYVAAVIQYKESILSGKEKEKCEMQKIEKTVEILQQKYGFLYHLVVMDKNRIAIILSFTSKFSVLSINKVLSDLEEIMNPLVKETETTGFAVGQLYRSILDLRFSYSSALESLEQKQRGLETEKGPNAEGRPALNERAEQVFRLAMQNDMDSAEILAERVLTNIKTVSDDKCRVESYRIFLAALIVCIAKLEYVDTSEFQNEFLTMREEDLRDMDPEKLDEMVHSICEQLLNQLTKTLKKQQNRYIVAARKYIDENFSDSNLYLNVIAEAVHVNPTYLSRLFKSNLGIYFTDYLNKYRVERSILLLENTSKSIKEVAFECGFNSVQNYIRVFKKHIGLSPGQYRDKHSKENTE